MLHFSQELEYNCRNLPLINDGNPTFSYFKDGNGVASPNWAGADHSDIVGCGCVLVGACPSNHTCHCDSRTNKMYTEGGYVTNKEKLPVSAVVTGGAGTDSEGSFFVGPLGCAPQPFSE